MAAPPPPPPPPGPGAEPTMAVTPLKTVKFKFFDYQGSPEAFSQINSKNGVSRDRSLSNASNTSTVSTESTKAGEGSNSEYSFMVVGLVEGKECAVYLGGGREGSVYTAQVLVDMENEETKKTNVKKVVAVKYATPHALTAMKTCNDALQKEYNALCMLQTNGKHCANIVDVYGFLPGESHAGGFRRAAIIMERIKGTTLEHFNLPDNWDANFAIRKNILKGFANATDHLYKNNYTVDDDITSGNLMITETHDAKVIDFGAAREGKPTNAIIHLAAGTLFKKGGNWTLPSGLEFLQTIKKDGDPLLNIQKIQDL
ncbi:hypothetical protein BGX34_003227 [Mortierella sp. NVP85]|nr:hypothetical protein BGX34_003227 [Mortierella sp. NVP85]